jgi:hypothetical protein
MPLAQQEAHQILTDVPGGTRDGDSHEWSSGGPRK